MNDIDPTYVKTLKMDILFKLVTEETIDVLLSEFEFYLLSPDVNFVSYGITVLIKVTVDIGILRIKNTKSTGASTKRVNLIGSCKRVNH